MTSTKLYFILQVLLLMSLWLKSDALQCKTCQKNDPGCLSGEAVEIRNCVSDNDVCYSWFDRTKSEVGVQRDCISTDTPEYKTMKQMIRNRNDGCVKRLNGLDCFTFCSDDKCN